MECGVYECDCEASIVRRPWPNRSCCAMGQKQICEEPGDHAGHVAMSSEQNVSGYNWLGINYKREDGTHTDCKTLWKVAFGRTSSRRKHKDGILCKFHVTRMVDKRHSKFCLMVGFGISGIQHSVIKRPAINNQHYFVSPDVLKNISCASKNTQQNRRTNCIPLIATHISQLCNHVTQHTKS